MKGGMYDKIITLFFFIQLASEQSRYPDITDTLHLGKNTIASTVPLICYIT